MRIKFLFCPANSNLVKFWTMHESLFSNSEYFPSLVSKCFFIQFYDLAHCDSRRKVRGNGASDAVSRNTHIVSGGGASVQIRLSFFFPSIQKACTKKATTAARSLARSGFLFIALLWNRTNGGERAFLVVPLSFSLSLSFLFSC